MQLRLGKYRLDLSEPKVMGVLNRTPDSFSDGGAFADFDAALRHAEDMAKQGAAILDIGGESTRPGAQPVGIQEEMDRVLPLVEKLAAELDLPVSVDTSKPAVMRAAVAAGAAMINDVYALRQPDALATAAGSKAAVCLMHMQGEPRSMQKEPRYLDVVEEVKAFLLQRAQECAAGGIERERIVLDPGFGFGKNLQHNLELLRRLPELAELGYPLLVGISRKSMIGTLLGNRPSGERLYGSLAAAVTAVLRGAHIVRTHDVAATVDATRVAAALRAPIVPMLK